MTDLCREMTLDEILTTHRLHINHRALIELRDLRVHYEKTQGLINQDNGWVEVEKSRLDALHAFEKGQEAGSRGNTRSVADKPLRHCYVIARDALEEIAREAGDAIAQPEPRGDAVVTSCPGCHSAIYDGAAERGWCLDCRPLSDAELDEPEPPSENPTAGDKLLRDWLSAIPGTEDSPTDSTVLAELCRRALGGQP